MKSARSPENQTPAFQSWTNQSISDVAKAFTVDAARGLTEAEVLRRRSRFGRNVLSVAEVGWWAVLRRQFRSAYVWLLLGAAGLALLLREVIDGMMIMVFIVINTLLGFVQEFRSEQTLKILRTHTVPRARVRRGGVLRLVSSVELVPGDIVVIEAGDLLPADLRLIAVEALTLNESTLTGESVAVSKGTLPLPDSVGNPVAARNIAFGGTSVVAGKAEGIVVATGQRTVAGDIARLTAERRQPSSFEIGVRQFSSFTLRFIALTLAAVVLAHLVFRRGVTDPSELALFAIALAVSVIPEALPVVSTFALSHGARLLARRHVLVKRLSAVEELGSIDILCSDKTGTITENHLIVAATRADDPAALLEMAALGATLRKETREPNNAFDVAVWSRLSAEVRTRVQHARVEAEVPFDPQRRRNSVLVTSAGRTQLIVRGAPEAVWTGVSGLLSADVEALSTWAAQEGRRGRRVLAVAAKSYQATTTYDPAEETRGLQLVGLLSFTDPIKPTTQKTLIEARKLGVHFKLLTGDSPEVAGAVAHEVGLIPDPTHVITGPQFDALPEPEQLLAAARETVFARVTPYQKYRIVELLQQHSAVGFLGEGINDAPALKRASVGLVVDHASDIARSAADVILLEKRLDVILDGIREGRRVFANTVKYLTITLASNFGNFFAVAIASLVVTFLPMLPLQLLLVNLLSDFPMIAIATDAVEWQSLRRPRSYDVRDIIVSATLLGLVSMVFDFIYFGLFVGLGPTVLQTNWFIGSILTELLLIFVLRTKLAAWRGARPSPVLSWLVGVAVLVTIVLPLTWFGQSFFHFQAPTATHVLLIIGIAVAYGVVSEITKRWVTRISVARNERSAAA